MTMKTLLAQIIVFCVLGSAPSWAQAPAANTLPDGKGREIVGVACSQCHGLGVFTKLRQGPQAWRFEIYEMVARGAQISPSELDTVVDYLTTNFGPGVDIPASTEIKLPDGKGKEFVEGGCVTCHGLDRVVAARRSPLEWRRIVHRMIFLGSTLPDDDVAAATDYLNAISGLSERTSLQQKP
jgi:mono/diheme cytochrome c family protein